MEVGAWGVGGIGGCGVGRKVVKMEERVEMRG